MRLTYCMGLVCTGLLLTACAELPKPVSETQNWQARSARLTALSHWSARGKLAIRTANQSESGTLEWVQADKSTQIMISGPMGLGAISIESDQETVHISHGGQIDHYDISSPSRDGAAIGWDLPLQALPYWILGLPMPSSPVQDKVVEQGILRRVEQLGWTITYDTYGQFKQYTLPTRLSIERGHTRARLIIRNWTGFSS